MSKSIQVTAADLKQLAADCISLDKARLLVPGWPHVSCLTQWAKGKNSAGAVLRTVTVGRRLFTTREWIAQFLNDSAAAKEKAREAAREKAQARRKPRRMKLISRTHEEADARLRAKGL